MSQENVELVERAIAALNARQVAAYIACCAAHMTLETPLAVVGGAYEGSDGIRRFFNDIEEAAPDFRIEVERMQEVDPMCVIAFVRTSSTGRASGISVAAATSNVYEIVEGKISRIRIFLDRNEAMKAVGLGE
jgi:ketosteroid isomerase-like protein